MEARLGDVVEYRGTQYEVTDLLAGPFDTTVDLTPTRPGRTVQYGVPVAEVTVAYRADVVADQGELF